MLDVLRFCAGLAWFMVFLFLIGSPIRWALKRPNFKDRQWIMCWFFAILMTGYFARLVMGWAPSIEFGPALRFTIGLQTLSLLIALRILHIRIDQQGWRP